MSSGDNAPSPRDIAEVLLPCHAGKIAFSILITNVDDHLMNHCFLHVDRGFWRLALAFDINPFPERLRELKTWVSQEAGPEATIDALISGLPYFRISRSRAKDMLAQVEKAATGVAR